MALVLNGYTDVVLVNMLNDYRCNFSGRACKITTNYKGLKEFEVAFFDEGLPHLLGLHYVGKYRSGMKILKEIDTGKMTAQTIRNHHQFGPMDIRNRVLLYPFIYEVFVDQKIKICIPMEHVKPNNMKLDCVFTKMGTKEEIVLGLKRDSKDGIFKLSTLHSNKRAKYTKMKCSKVESIIWFD